VETILTHVCASKHRVLFSGLWSRSARAGHFAWSQSSDKIRSRSSV